MTYGGMAREPVAVPASALIFKDVRVRGFWMSRWNDEANLDERLHMLENLARLAQQGRFVGPPLEPIRFDDDAAIMRAVAGPMRGSKRLLIMADPAAVGR